MHEIVRDLEFVYRYLNDILVLSQDVEIHLQHFQILFFFQSKGSQYQTQGDKV